MTLGDDEWLAVVGNLGMAKELGAVIADIEPGGGGSKGVGKFLQSGVTGGVAVRGGDVGDYP